MFASLLPPGGRILEIGVGTGRIARSALANHNTLVGIDISRKMMEQFRLALLSGMPSPLLIQGNASSLPLTCGCMDVVVAVHVFHLIPAWQQAVSEAQRVLKPGGMILLGSDDSPPDTPYSRIQEYWGELVQKHTGRRAHRGSISLDEVQQYLISTGAQVNILRTSTWNLTKTPAQIMQRFEQRVFSHTWTIPDGDLQAMVHELGDWMLAEFGSLDQEIDSPTQFVLRVNRW